MTSPSATRVRVGTTPSLKILRLFFRSLERSISIRLQKETIWASMKAEAEVDGKEEEEEKEKDVDEDDEEGMDEEENMGDILKPSRETHHQTSRAE